MDRVATLPAEERTALFRETGARLDIGAGLIEKDFWVCWTLKHLFSVADLRPRILFKGGTTLSKIFSVIRRFSEDIDLAVDYKMLGFTGERCPTAQMSNTKRTKILDEMLVTCRHYIATEFLSLLRSRMAEILPDRTTWELYVDPEDGHIVNFRYPRAAEAVTYLRPEVRLELGTHAELIPNDRYIVRAYAAEEFPAAFEEPECPVQAIKIERTFWEKATILHQEHFRTSGHAAAASGSREVKSMWP